MLTREQAALVEQVRGVPGAEPLADYMHDLFELEWPVPAVKALVRQAFQAVERERGFQIIL
jgi:hypothetical protein